MMIEKDKYFKSSVEIKIETGNQIINVVPADFDHDGHLDVLVMSASTNKDEYELTGVHNNIFLGNGATLSILSMYLFVGHNTVCRSKWLGCSQ